VRFRWLLGLLLLTLATAATAEEGPASSELAAARYYLEIFEDRVRREDGRPFELGYYEEQALSRIESLAQRYPADPQVMELVERAGRAVSASKGVIREITPEMLAYRRVEAELTATLGALANAAWAERLEGWRAESPAPLLPGDPWPDPEVVGTEPMLGRRVVLDGFRWPAQQFLDNGRDYVFVGSAATGFYFVRLDEPGYKRSYAALRRFRSSVSSHLPESWTVAGRIADVDMTIPQAGEEKTLPPYFGWVIDADAIYLPGLVLALAGDAETEGAFVGEAEVAAMQAAAFTVDAVPAEIEPAVLAGLFATAIKEKNYRLYLECLSPALQRTDVQREQLRYYWDINQRSYRESYVLVEPGEVSPVESVDGYAAGDAQGAVERVRVAFRRYDEHGQRFGAAGELVLERTPGGRWYVVRGFPL